MEKCGADQRRVDEGSHAPTHYPRAAAVAASMNFGCTTTAPRKPTERACSSRLSNSSTSPRPAMEPMKPMG
jgi:hypothetical protein